MVVDLHAHYPMRVVSDVTPRTAIEQMRRAQQRPTLPDKLRALALRLASTFFSHRDPFAGYRITVRELRDGGVGVVLSVLYRPGEELDPCAGFGSPPESSYFAPLLRDLETVEREVASYDRSVIRVAHDREELDACLADGATALVHCVEGGFHLGARPDEVEANVAELARRGVAYITVAHLFFRGVATVAPALPFLPDDVYRRLFPQRAGEGLTELGAAAVRAMARHRVLVDIAHMRGDAIDETFGLLDEADPARSLPVLSTHAGFRFGEQQYMHDAGTLLRIAERDGVVGLIMAQHQLLDGMRDDPPPDFEASFGVVREHVDRIAAITGSHRHVALGTDFDGFIRPTLPGLERTGDLALLESALREHYGDDVGEQIASGNALRVLQKAWA